MTMSVYWVNSNPTDSLFDHEYIEIYIPIVKNKSWSVLVFGSADLLWTQHKHSTPIFIILNWDEEIL